MGLLELTVALFLLVGAQLSSAVPAEPKLAHAASKLGPTQILKSDTKVVRNARNEPVVRFGSGRELPLSAHHRLLDILTGDEPVTVILATGEKRTFSSGQQYMSVAQSEDFDGAKFIVPAETFSCEVVKDVVMTELARRTQMVMPNGDVLPYDEYMSPRHPKTAHPVYVEYPDPRRTHLFHKEPTVSLEGIPDDKLMVALGGSQRLAKKVHDSILKSYRSKAPLEVALVTGKVVTIHTYTELLSKLVDPRYMGALVRLSHDVEVPVETYRAVVEAHKHTGVYIIGPEDQRVPYTDYIKQTATSDEAELTAVDNPSKNTHA